jgi:hypothetical protein
MHWLAGNQQDGRVRVPQVMQPDRGQHVLAEGLAAAGHGGNELPGGVLGVAVSASISPNTSASSRASWSAIRPRALRQALSTVTVAASRSTTRGLPLLVSESVISAPSPAIRTMPTDRRTRTVPASRSMSRQRRASASPRRIPVIARTYQST